MNNSDLFSSQTNGDMRTRASSILCADEKLKICRGGALNLGQAKSAPKQLNLESLVLRILAKEWGLALLLGEQAGPEFSGCPTTAEFNFLAVRSIIP